MKILFIGIEPSSDLKKFLDTHECTISLLKRPPSKPKSTSIDVVIFGPKTLEDVADLQKIRKSLPKAWLCLVIKSAWFSKVELQDTLMLAPEQDEIWVRDYWEKTCLLCLHKMIEHRHTSQELAALERQCRVLKQECNELSEKSGALVKQLERDVDLAANIQRWLLPKRHPKIPGVNLATKYLPSAGVGGDYFDIFEFVDHKRYGFLIADSKSHGMAAALLTVLIKIRLEEMKERFPDSKSFVEYINQEIQNAQLKEMASLSLLYGILDRSTLTFQYTVAGTLNPVLWRLGELTPLNTAPNPSLGEANQFEFKESFMTLKPADLLLIATDGLEAPLTTEEKSPRETLLEILSTQDPSPDPFELQNEIMAHVDQFIDKKPLPDDLTLIQILIKEGRTLRGIGVEVDPLHALRYPTQNFIGYSIGPNSHIAGTDRFMSILAN